MNRVEVTLQDILWSLKKYLLWIVLACVIGAVGAYTYTEIFQAPVYAARISMVVFASDRQSSDFSSGDLSAGSSLATTYVALMNSQPVCDAVSEALGGKVSSGAVSGMVSAARSGSSLVINVTVRSGDAKLAVEVANALLDVAPDVLTGMVGGKVSKVNRANSAGQVSPDLSANVIYGLLGGLLLSCAVVILIAILDTTVWREDDLERAFDIPVLGGIPSMGSVGGDKSRKGV